MYSWGFFGGTFDPIHFGHINLAISLLEQHSLKGVLFCPAFCSIFKTMTPPIVSAEDRLAMLQLAIQDIPQFRICRLEIDSKAPAYTIDTIRSLKKEYPSLRLFLSDESFAHFDQWKEPEELTTLAPPLIGPRTNVSGTQIRARLKEKLYCGHLLPEKVLDYIHKNHLYS